MPIRSVSLKERHNAHIINKMKTIPQYSFSREIQKMIDAQIKELKGDSSTAATD